MKRFALCVCLAAGMMFPVAAQETPRRLTLPEAVKLAGELSPEIQMANLTALEREAEIQKVRSGYLPQVSVVAQGTGQTTNLEGIGLTFPGISRRVGPYSTFNARPVATQTVLDLSLLAEIRGARERWQEARWQLAVAREATLLAVVQLYLQALAADSQWQAALARWRTAESTLQQAKDLEEAGSASKLDVARAEEQHQRERAIAATARGARDMLHATLLRMIGLEAREDVELAPIGREQYTLENLDEALAVARQERPEVRMLAARERGAAASVKAAGSQRYPKITAAGDYGVFGAAPWQSLSTYTVGATLSIPVYTGRRIESEIALAQARAGQARLAQREQDLRISEEVKRAIVEAEASREALRAASQAAAAAREALELSRLRFSAGLTTNLDVVTAQGRLAQAEDFEIRSRYDYSLAQARLARAKGNISAFVETR